MSSNGNAGTFTSPDILVSFRYSNHDTLSVVNEPQKNLCKYTSHGFYHAPVRTNTFLAGKQQFLIKRLEVFGFEWHSHIFFKLTHFIISLLAISHHEFDTFILPSTEVNFVYLNKNEPADFEIEFFWLICYWIFTLYPVVQVVTIN